LKRTVLILAMLALCSPFALGQAIPGATRVVDVSVGATFTYARPDYTPQNALGYGIFGTFDFTPHWGAELDYHSVSIQQHSPSKEWSFEYGVRYHRTYGRFNPYLKAMGGRATFDSIPGFYQGNASPSYNIIAFGGGLDTVLTPRFSVRVGAEYQNWFTGGVTGPPNSGGPGTDVYLPHGLTPVLFEVGLSYHFTGGSNIQ
jgi:hypothetical protein